MGNFHTFQNPILSLWQSAIRKVGKSGVFHDPKEFRMHDFVSLINSFVQAQEPHLKENWGNMIDQCVRLIVKIARAEMVRDEKQVEELLNEFKNSACDPGWFQVLRIYWESKTERERIPYIRHTRLSDFVIRIPNKLKIAFLADWGTGQKNARWLLKQVLAHKPDLLVHLGDIYYAGTLDEVRDHFLSIVRKEAGDTPVFTLSGNHDMYSGGKGFYWLLKQLHQPASYFCLRNDYWQLLGMDTGLYDVHPFTASSNLTHLDPGEAEWHLDKFKTADGRKTILMSHHQLYSALGVATNKQGEPLAYNWNLHGVFRDVLDQVSLWLWGHEHNLIVFEPYLNLQKGRCIGAGAVPVMIEQKPYTPSPHLNLQSQPSPPIMDLKKAKLSVNTEGFFFHSYAIMSLQDTHAMIGYYEVNSFEKGPSRLLFRENIT